MSATDIAIEDSGKILLGLLGAGAAGAAAGKDGSGILNAGASNYTNILTILAGAISSSKDENGRTVSGAAETVNTASNLSIVAKGINEFINGKKSGAATLGDMVEGIVGYANFKDDLDNGDSVLSATVKTLILKKTLSFLTEKVAEMAYNHSTTLQTVADGVGNFAKSAGGHGLPDSVVAAVSGQNKSPAKV